jgi:choline kinase
MSEYDLNKVDKAVVKLEKYITLLWVKYGYTREDAKKEIGKRVAEYDAEQKGSLTLHDDAPLSIKHRPVERKKTRKIQRQESGTLKTVEQVFSGEPFKNDSLGG